MKPEDFMKDDVQASVQLIFDRFKTAMNSEDEPEILRIINMTLSLGAKLIVWRCYGKVEIVEGVLDTFSKQTLDFAREQIRDFEAWKAKGKPL